MSAHDHDEFAEYMVKHGVPADYQLQEKVNPQKNPPNPKQRYGDLKPNLALVPSPAAVYMAKALGDGARKYGPYNWRDKAVEAATYVAACERHLRAWYDGEEIDPDSGNPHLAHAIACLAILIDAIETPGCLLDNRPKASSTGELLRRMSASPELIPIKRITGDDDHAVAERFDPFKGA